MTSNFEARVGQNEALFRQINERIEAGHWPGEDAERVAFLCECSMLGCNLLVELTPAEYEAVRADPRRFLVVPGHELPEFESVVESRDGDDVVEKRDDTAAAVAEETDPRS